MGGCAADYGAKADYRVITAREGHFFCGQRNFERAGAPGDIDILFGNFMTFKTVHRAAQEFGDYELVETGADDTHVYVFVY